MMESAYSLTVIIETSLILSAGGTLIGQAVFLMISKIFTLCFIISKIKCLMCIVNLFFMVYN